MKKLRKILLVLILMLVVVPFNVKADEKVINIYLFYGDGCPHCAAEEEFLDEYLKDKDNVKLYKYEVWYDKTNQEYLQKVQKKLNNKQSGVPYTVIGDKVLLGYMDGVTDVTIKNYIDYYYNNDYVDYVGKITNVSYIKDDSDKINARKKEDKKIIYDDPEVEISTNKNKDENKLEKSNEEVLDNVDNMLKKYPVLNKLSAKKISLPLLSIVLGLVDGFNPCAMWILLLLINMCISIKDKKKMRIVGFTFILSSGLVYFLSMLGIGFIIDLSTVIYIRNIIAILAVILGIYNLYVYIKTRKDTGCHVMKKEKRKNIITRINKILANKSLILMILGTTILSVSVNLVELACSFGFPTIFLEILTLNKIMGLNKVLYLLIYIFFYIIDDLIILILSLKAFETKGISTKYNKYVNLIAGILLVLMGILLIFKPEWVMLNF